MFGQVCAWAKSESMVVACLLSRSAPCTSVGELAIRCIILSSLAVMVQPIWPQHHAELLRFSAGVGGYATV